MPIRESSHLLVGEYYNTYTRNRYPATIQIRPAGSEPRIVYNFTFGMANDYQTFIANAAASYR